MAHTCPWWLGYLLIAPLRRLAQDPAAILGPHVREGMTVLEPGPGMGFFTLELARRVGPSGKVVCTDLQQRMLDTLARRAERAGLRERLELRTVSEAEPALADLEGKVDFALAFAMVHEVPDPARFLRELARTLKPDGRLLLSEPAGHVTRSAFEETLRLAAGAGLAVEARPAIRFEHSALLHRAR